MAAIINKSVIDPVGSPLVRVLFKKRMIAADFLGDPTGTELDMPSQTHRASGGLTAGICGPAFSFWQHEVGRRGTPMEDDALRPVISIVAQSVSIELILPPEMRHSRPALFKQAKKALGIQSRRDGFGRDGCGPGRCRPSPPTEYAKHGSIPWLR